MGEESAPMDAEEARPASKKLTLLPLVALIFYEVSGGPFGIEDSVSTGGGPLLSLLGFLLFPLLWSLPEALITAELAACFPKNGGYVHWIASAYGPFWGFQVGIWKWVSGTMDSALYPVLFFDYLRQSLPLLALPAARVLALLVLTSALTFLNYRGISIVGRAAIALTAFSISPFVVMTLLAIPRIRPHRWLVVDLKKANFRGFFNIMFWNLNYWDKASTIAGEVEDPSRTFPRAVLGAIVLVVATYLVPLLAGTGALDESKIDEWKTGYFAQVGMAIGGGWLRGWIQVAAAMSNMGLFEAEMTSDSFQLLGMSEIGMLPAIFSRRSKHGTPTFSILCSAAGVLLLSWLSFQEIVEFLNFLYAISMVLELTAFLRLRIQIPNRPTAYRIPVETFGAVIICTPPAILLMLVICLASMRTYMVTAGIVLLGFVLYAAVELMRTKKLVKFISTTVLPESGSVQTRNGVKNQEPGDEASMKLLPGECNAEGEGEHQDLTEDS